MLHRRTFAGKDREGEEAADYGNCAEDACDGQFTDVCFFHYDHSLMGSTEEQGALERKKNGDARLGVSV